jgi:hypothetical protein
MFLNLQRWTSFRRKSEYEHFWDIIGRTSVCSRLHLQNNAVGFPRMEDKIQLSSRISRNIDTYIKHTYTNNTCCNAFYVLCKYATCFSILNLPSFPKVARDIQYYATQHLTLKINSNTFSEYN